jgi:hypothetical protein
MNDEPDRAPGIAVLVIPMPGGMAAPTDTFPSMIAWLYHHGGPRTGEVLTRLERHGWELELPDPDAGKQTELWASARFADVAHARAAVKPFQGRVGDKMRWAPVDRPGEAAMLPVDEPPGANRRRPP